METKNLSDEQIKTQERLELKSTLEIFKEYLPNIYIPKDDYLVTTDLKGEMYAKRYDADAKMLVAGARIMDKGVYSLCVVTKETLIHSIASYLSGHEDKHLYLYLKNVSDEIGISRNKKADMFFCSCCHNAKPYRHYKKQIGTLVICQQCHDMDESLATLVKTRQHDYYN